MGAAQLRADPLDDFDTSALDQRRQFRRAATVDQLVSHPLGVHSGERFLRRYEPSIPQRLNLSFHQGDLLAAATA